MLRTLIILYYYIKTRYFSHVSDRKRLEKRQDAKVCRFLKKQIPKSGYYEKKFRNLDIRNWRDFPIMDKKEMMENFDTLNTVGISKEEAFRLALEGEKSRNFKPEINNVTVGLSSGTSGNRGIFLVSRHEQYRWIGTILAKTLPGSILGKHRIAFFLRADSNLYEGIKSRTIRFQFFDMLKTPEENLRKLDSFKPTILVAPPSMLKVIARNLDKISVNPKKIISVAEVLEDLDRKFLEKAFGRTIHQIYQATEGFLACSCRYGCLHVNEDILVMQKEYLDEHRFVPVITDFSRTSQPVIRYRLNDILTESTERCPCGSAHLVLKKIEGRCDDIFYLQSANDESMVAIFPDFLSRAVIFASDVIEEYRVIQTSRSEIQVYVDRPEEFTRVKDSLIRLFTAKKCRIPEIIPLSGIKTDSARKFKRIENRVHE